MEYFKKGHGLCCICRQLPTCGNFTVGQDYYFEYIIDGVNIFDDSKEFICLSEQTFKQYFEPCGEVVTTFCPILADHTTYCIYFVLAGNTCNLEEIKACAKIQNINYLQAKYMLSQKRCFMFSGSAYEVKQILEKLAPFHISYEIEPPYPHNDL